MSRLRVMVLSLPGPDYLLGAFITFAEQQGLMSGL